MSRKLSISFLFFLFFYSGYSQYTKPVKYGLDTTGSMPSGLVQGVKAPRIIAQSINGDPINSVELLKEKSIVLIFYRGEWCPVCNKYLSNLNDSLSYILEKNAVVIAISPETIDNAHKTESQTSAAFIIIPDTTHKIMLDYDVLFNVTDKYQKKISRFLSTDIAANNHEEDAHLPVPATYIINKNGIISYVQFDYNYKNRASVKDIIDHL